MLPYLDDYIGTIPMLDVSPAVYPVPIEFYDIVYVYFSKNRPAQLDLALRSHTYHNYDLEYAQREVVLFKATSDIYLKGYEKLEEENRSVSFLEEMNFKKDLLDIIGDHKYVVFVVDDTIFVRPYSALIACRHIESQPSVLGMSLRLGENTVYCYPFGKNQSVPKREQIFRNYYIHNWTLADYDFGYPLEISSSIYPTEKIRTPLEYGDYSNPNDLEWSLSQYTSIIGRKAPYLLTNRYSTAFSNPVNKVQTVNRNRSGTNSEYSPLKLAERFLNGERIDLRPFIDYTPWACHEEVDYEFIRESEL